MVTSYCIMQMMNKKNDVSSYHNEFSTKLDSLSVIKILSNKPCRICLQEGTVDVIQEENSSEIIDCLLSCAAIKINKHDDLPTHLCATCFKFVKIAITFRLLALKSDQILKLPMKKEDDKEYCNNFQYDNIDDLYPHTADEMVIEDNINSKTKTNPRETNSKIMCEVCNSVVSLKYYKTHKTMHDPNHKKFICDICGKAFRLGCAYYNHRSRHSIVFAYTCRLCPYKARYKDLLRNHMRTHSQEFAFMCNECPARFLFKTNLNAHIMRKHREPRYKCNTCNRLFHTIPQQQRHHDVDHLGIRRHICDICGKAFGYKHGLRKHELIVHKREKMPGRMPTYMQAQLSNLD